MGEIPRLLIGGDGASLSPSALSLLKNPILPTLGSRGVGQSDFGPCVRDARLCTAASKSADLKYLHATKHLSSQFLTYLPGESLVRLLSTFSKRDWTLADKWYERRKTGKVFSYRLSLTVVR